jgi:hypothetical protein
MRARSSHTLSGPKDPLFTEKVIADPLARDDELSTRSRPVATDTRIDSGKHLENLDVQQVDGRKHERIGHAKPSRWASVSRQLTERSFAAKVVCSRRSGYQFGRVSAYSVALRSRR